MGSLEVSGKWSEADVSCHINLLELRAIFLSLRHWSRLVRGKSVAVCSDNTTALSYVRKQGGTFSLSLCQEAWSLLLWAEKHQVSLSTQFVRGKHNVLADQLSRGDTIQPSEWTLHREVCHRMWNLWGQPSVDLFATRRNFRLPRFYSPVMDELAVGVDAFLHSWDDQFVYAFPPFSIIREVINKIISSVRTEVILVTPWWPQREWFPDLYRLSVDPPRRLPLWVDLLSQPLGEVLHGNLPMLALTAWRLSSESCAFRVSPDRSPGWQPGAIGARQPPCTSLAGRGSDLGVPLGVYQSPEPLP